MKIVILDGYALNPGDLSWDELRKVADVEVHDRTPEAEVVARAADADMVMTNKTPLSAATLGQLPNLRYIGVLATGYNVIDTAAAQQRGIVVTNIPTYGTASVAQFAIALLLELCHHVGLHGEAVRNGEWSQNPDWSFWKTPLIELSGRTMGVVGFGRIGRQTAAIASALGMRIVANDEFEVNAPDYPDFAWLPVDKLMRESDVVSLHCPLFPENKGMINREGLGADEAVGIPAEYLSRAACRRPGSRRRSQSGRDRGRRPRRPFGRAACCVEPAVVCKELYRDAAHRLGNEGGTVAFAGYGCREREGIRRQARSERRLMP